MPPAASYHGTPLTAARGVEQAVDDMWREYVDVHGEAIDVAVARPPAAALASHRFFRCGF